MTAKEANEWLRIEAALRASQKRERDLFKALKREHSGVCAIGFCPLLKQKKEVE